MHFIKLWVFKTRHCSGTYQIFSRSFNETVSVQAGKFVKLFHEDSRLNILKIGNIPPVQISPENISNISWCNDGGSCNTLGKVENKLFLLCQEKNSCIFVVKNYPHCWKKLTLTGISFQIREYTKFSRDKFPWICVKKSETR